VLTYFSSLVYWFFDFTSFNNKEVKPISLPKECGIENLPGEIWQKIILYNGRSMALVCKKLNTINKLPPITAILLDAHSHRHCCALEKVLNREVGLFVKHLTCGSSSRSAIQLITNYCLNCETLDLSNSNITDADLKNLADKKFLHLKSLNLSYCNGITNQGLEHLKVLSSLQSLELSGCEQITDQGIKHLEQQFEITKRFDPYSDFEYKLRCKQAIASRTN
jgi:hypothetical protein